MSNQNTVYIESTDYLKRNIRTLTYNHPTLFIKSTLYKEVFMVYFLSKLIINIVNNSKDDNDNSSIKIPKLYEDNRRLNYDYSNYSLRMSSQKLDSVHKLIEDNISIEVNNLDNLMRSYYRHRAILTKTTLMIDKEYHVMTDVFYQSLPVYPSGISNNKCIGESFNIEHFITGDRYTLNQHRRDNIYQLYLDVIKPLTSYIGVGDDSCNLTIINGITSVSTDVEPDFFKFFQNGLAVELIIESIAIEDIINNIINKNILGFKYGILTESQYPFAIIIVKQYHMQDSIVENIYYNRKNVDSPIFTVV